MRLLLLGCGILQRELCDAIVHSPHLVDAKFLPAGVHDQGAENMLGKLQAAIDAEECNHDAVVLGYALCGNGIVGLKARGTPLVVPRAHDCITLLLGSRAKFQKYFEENAGVYYRSVGWVEHAEDLQQQIVGGGIDYDLNALIERYGADNGKYLYDEYTKYTRTYSKLTFIETGLEPDGTFIERARAEAREKNWAFSNLAGDLTLFRRLLSGEWDEDFLIVPPGSEIAPTYDQGIMKAVPGESQSL